MNYSLCKNMHDLSDGTTQVTFTRKITPNLHIWASNPTCFETHEFGPTTRCARNAWMRSRLLHDFWIKRVSRSACRWLLIRALRSLSNHDTWSPIQCNELLHLFRPGIPGIDNREFRWYKHMKVSYLCRCLHRKDSAVCLAAYPLYYTVVGSVRDTERDWEGEWESEDRGRPLYTGMMPLLRDLNRNMQPPVMLEEDAIIF